MISQNAVFQGVHDALAAAFTFPGVDGPNLYENQVVGSLPTDAHGRILPGVIFQLRHAVPVADNSLSSVQVLDARIHRLQTRVFAADETVLRDAVDHVMVTLTGLRIGSYSLRLTTEDEPSFRMLRDPDIDRPYTYMHWRIAG